MRVLVLGGTGFVGRYVVEGALARGHAVTVFHRGRSNPGLFPQAEHLIGDREADLSPLAGRIFDAVFDTTGFEVRHVRSAAATLAHPELQYVFVSSISVYAELAHLDESGPLRTTDDAENAILTLANYGALKAACEAAIDEELGRPALHVRAGLILGPHDYDERFRFWLDRVARGGEVLAPGDKTAIAQAIDVRDLAEWMLASATRKLTGPFNVTGEPLSMELLLDTVRDVVGGHGTFAWVPDEVLLAHDVKPYSEMPFWLPKNLGAAAVDIRKALAEGLTLRPFRETAHDAWEWMLSSWDADESVRSNRKIRVPAGMSTERERAILAAARAEAPPPAC